MSSPGLIIVGRVVDALLALLLLTSSYLKWSDMSFSSPSAGATATIVAFEVAVATCLLLGRPALVYRSVASILFTVFAVVAASRFLQGETTCGCFGDVQVGPRTAFAIDVTALLLLLLTARFQKFDLRYAIGGTLRFALLLLVCLSTTVGFSRLMQAKIGLAFVSNGRIESSVSDTSIEHLIEIANNGDEPIRITGSSACCGARLELSQAMLLQPQEITRIPLLMKAEKRVGRYQRKISIFVDHESVTKLSYPVTLTVSNEERDV